jgi:peptide/nickel transport system substrate-binding protein
MLAYRDEPESALTAVYKPIAKIDTPDRLTVIVTLEKPFSPFLAWGGQMFIARKKDYEAYKGKLQDAPAGKQPVGSGGYKWVETVPGSHTRLTANRDWWRGGGWKPEAGRGGPFIETLVHKHYKDANAWLLGFLAGEVDTLYPVAPKDVESLGQVDTWIYDTRSTVTETMLFNFNNPDRPAKTIFEDLRVRQAMAYAIDYDKMGKAVWRGYWEPRWSMELHPWMLKPLDQQKGYGYDPKKSADLLAQAGWRKGSDGILANDKGEKFKILGISGKGYLAPEYAQIAQQFFKEVGVDMEYRTLESGPLREAFRTTHKWDVAFARKWGWGYPESFRDITTGSTPPVGLNYGAYSNAEIDRLWDQILVTLDQKQAIPLFHKLQDIQAEDLARLWFGAPHDVVAIRKHILGHQPNPMWQDWDPFWWYVA